MVLDSVQGCVRGRAENDEGDANSRQVAGDHYRKHGDLQHWDVVAHFGLDYYQGQITRYVFRWRDKGGVEDLKKARHYLDKYIELIEAGTVPGPHKKEDRS